MSDLTNLNLNTEIESIICRVRIECGAMLFLVKYANLTELFWVTNYQLQECRLKRNLIGIHHYQFQRWSGVAIRTRIDEIEEAFNLGNY